MTYWRPSARRILNVTNSASGQALGNNNPPSRFYGTANMGIGKDPAHRLDVGGSIKGKGLITHVNAGAISDAQFDTIEDGMIAVDSFNNRIGVRIGGVWEYVAAA